MQDMHAMGSGMLWSMAVLGITPFLLMGVGILVYRRTRKTDA